VCVGGVVLVGLWRGGTAVYVGVCVGAGKGVSVGVFVGVCAGMEVAVAGGRVGDNATRVGEGRKSAGNLQAGTATTRRVSQNRGFAFIRRPLGVW
jgi:hypothetical protein